MSKNVVSTKYSFIEQVRFLKAKGYSEKEIAEVFGMSVIEYRNRMAKEVLNN